ncbi:MAG: hypothetical protein J6W77_05340 [Prevotella sp.]|nr:hypothetical protein [Prevotella sp.]
MFRFDDIITLADVGVMKATSHTLSVQGAYTLTRFKAEVTRLTKEHQMRYGELLREVGIEDAAAFDAHHAELNAKKRTKDEQKEWEDDNDKIARLAGMAKALNNDEVTINCRPMSFEDWFNLKQENKELFVHMYNDKGEEIDKRELFDFIEILGENILWKAPEE